MVLLTSRQKKAAEKKESESTQDRVVQVDDLLSFRQFSKKSADDPIDVSLLSYAWFSVTYVLLQYVEDLGKATGAAEVREDFISNLSRISQLTGRSCCATRISGRSAHSF